MYVYCLYFNPLALNLSSVLAPSHMRRAPYVRGNVLKPGPDRTVQPEKP